MTAFVHPRRLVARRALLAVACSAVGMFLVASQVRFWIAMSSRSGLFRPSAVAAVHDDDDVVSSIEPSLPRSTSSRVVRRYRKTPVTSKKVVRKRPAGGIHVTTADGPTAHFRCHTWTTSHHGALFASRYRSGPTRSSTYGTRSS